jgi:DNA recombination protein RmuC
LIERFETQRKAISDSLADGRLAQQRESAQLRESFEAALTRHREASEQHQRDALKGQQEALTSGMAAMASQVGEAFRSSSDELGKRVDGLTQTTDNRLREISGQVEKRLAEGFEKTTETFTRVLEHLTRIDEAQKRITELSTSVVNLQEVLTDKRSRGAFGEVQLAGLVRNVMPEGSFDFQHTLSNGTRVDCLLTLPEPTGNVAIDAKFPLESFQRMLDNDLPDTDRARAARQFRLDIRKHIKDIADKYLIAGETADGAVMFLPAEAIFAEIHAHFPDLVEEAQRARVWLVSPTTLMAVLTTARAVLKDEATRKQVHIIQDHLRRLSEDFGRFRQRMDKLAVHIQQANDDVRQVNTSAQKISSRFQDIDQVQLPEPEDDDEPAALPGESTP